MSKRVIAIMGGTGFIGTHLCAKLASQGHDIVICSRRPEKHRELSILPNVKFVAVDYTDVRSIEQALAGCDTCINLLGILNENARNGKGFRQVHVYFTKAILQACEQVGIRCFLHMSALGADQAKGASHYLRSKGEAEAWVMSKHSSEMAVTVFRPSVIFGPGDKFLNKFASMLKFSPGIMPLPCANSLFAPVYVGDVVDAMIYTLTEENNWGETFDLCGPKIYTLYDLVKYVADIIDSGVYILPLGNKLSYLQAVLMDLLPGSPFTRDNYLSAMQPNISEAQYMESFPNIPLSVEAIVPTYLGDATTGAKLQKYRKLSSGENKS